MRASLAATLAVASAALLCAPRCAVAAAATYRIDPRETTAGFSVRFLGVFPVRGAFRRTTGTLVYDTQARQGAIDVVIDATTIEASTEKAQASARGPDFFNIEKFPSIEFRSSRFAYDGDRLAGVEGTLTLVGVSRGVTLRVIDSRCDAAAGIEPATCRADAELKVKRTDFGMRAWSHAVGDEVVIRISLVAREGVPSPAPGSANGAAKDQAKDAAKDLAKDPSKDEAK